MDKYKDISLPVTKRQILVTKMLWKMENISPINSILKDLGWLQISHKFRLYRSNITRRNVARGSNTFDIQNRKVTHTLSNVHSDCKYFLYMESRPVRVTLMAQPF